MFEKTPRISTAKAMLAPSADQHGMNVLGESFVRFLMWLPAASATNTWSVPSSGLTLTKAILLPSGDHAEDVAPIVVNLVTFGKLFQVTNTPVTEALGDIGVCNGVGRIVYGAPGAESFDLYAFSFQVPSVVEEQIEDLTTLIRSFNLPPGTANSLITKLQQALTAIDSGDIATACASLRTELALT